MRTTSPLFQPLRITRRGAFSKSPHHLTNSHIPHKRYTHISTTYKMKDKKTDALYQRDGNLYSHTSTLSSISPLSSLPPTTQPLFKPPQDSTPYILTTPSTIFHAQGGGQPSDTGSITLSSPTPSGSDPKFTVHQVRKVDAAILHLGSFDPPTVTLTEAEVGLEIKQDVDVPTRVLHSRLHTAGHVLGLAINMLSREGTKGVAEGIKDGKASHYPGMAFVENVGLIEGGAKAAIQERVDELVRGDHPVSGDLFLVVDLGGDVQGQLANKCRCTSTFGAPRRQSRSVSVEWTAQP